MNDCVRRVIYNCCYGEVKLSFGSCDQRKEQVEQEERDSPENDHEPVLLLACVGLCFCRSQEDVKWCSL